MLQTQVTSQSDSWIGYVRETIKLYKVRLGSVDCKRGGVVLPIKHVDVHPSYQSGQPSFDVALITLSQPVEMTEYIKPIRLSSVTNNVIKAKFMTTYWPSFLLFFFLKCKSRDTGNIHIILTYGKYTKQLYLLRSLLLSPDVGAPVIADDGLWGITSGWTSPQCSVYPSPTLVTRTAMPHVRSWLTSVLYRNSSTSVKNSENSDNTPPRRIYTVNLED
ncbi:hypothetical protein ABMA28_009524 [Loxostege sticticalis]|uniref:Peptidase S1 domain-containing protein n=1 Tax=Loxostege sticticalis TaxID=481309 RepID=A0ABD0SHE7_LOXSC